ncbi:IS607 family transposase [Streptomyces sp. UNOC14_S4]|uniref:IS607 family transposase n=1 Tax=Streptomyces sp. UNOC14_S4 TaxID=2872340 RepID=UPI001E32B12B|nr:IS607 family transposase [Streptomyces sp. UNOC14_S4]MCC3770765.1 IS607 family transposase [Streptomyces sp. UNOC14_S4]
MSEKADDWVSAGRAAKLIGVSTRTLRRYTLEGVLEDRRSPGGRRIFRVGDLDAVARRRGAPNLPPAGGVVLYGRVSSHRQRSEGDLDRQMARLRQAAGDRIVAGEFSDVASGLSDKRKGLRRALRACQAESVTTLLVTHEERLARFGTAMLAEVVLPSWGCQLEIAGGDEELDGTEDGDLVRDMLAVVTSFSGRLYGSRSAKARALTRVVKSTVEEGKL